jgi:hypothetical protein
MVILIALGGSLSRSVSTSLCTTPLASALAVFKVTARWLVMCALSGFRGVSRVSNVVYVTERLQPALRSGEWARGVTLTCGSSRVGKNIALLFGSQTSIHRRKCKQWIFGRENEISATAG